jgi:hypothetical protein
MNRIRPQTMKALVPGGLISADAPTGWTGFLISLFSVIDVHLIRER